MSARGVMARRPRDRGANGVVVDPDYWCRPVRSWDEVAVRFSQMHPEAPITPAGARIAGSKAMRKLRRALEAGEDGR